MLIGDQIAVVRNIDPVPDFEPFELGGCSRGDGEGGSLGGAGGSPEAPFGGTSSKKRLTNRNSSS